jgi:hypothetical protein
MLAMPEEPVQPRQELPPGDVDEFAGIEPARRVRSPIVALLAALTAGYLLYHLRVDLAYFVSSHAAEQAGDARRLASTTLPAPNRYVTVTGAPDRSNAALLDTRGKDEFRQFFRLLGTRSRLLVLRTYGALPAERAQRDEFTGRLIQFRDLSFADSIREWFRQRVVATHFLDPGELARARSGHEVTLNDLAGDAVHLTADTSMALDITFPEQYRVVLPRATLASSEAAAQALTTAGFADVTPAPLPVMLPDPTSYYLFSARPRDELREPVLRSLAALGAEAQVVVDPGDPAVLYIALRRKHYPEGITQAQRVLDQMGLPDAAPPPYVFFARALADRRDAVLTRLDQISPYTRVTPRQETVSRTFGSLGDLAFAQVSRVKVVEPLTVPEDAMVILEGDAPSSYWYVPVMEVALAAFLLFNLFALREALPWRFGSSTR